MHTVDEIPRSSLESMTPKRFYQDYLTSNLPVMIEDGCSEWPAIEKWKDLNYIGEVFGDK